jgi:hypothetical protein
MNKQGVYHCHATQSSSSAQNKSNRLSIYFNLRLSVPLLMLYRCDWERKEKTRYNLPHLNLHLHNKGARILDANHREHRQPMGCLENPHEPLDSRKLVTWAHGIYIYLAL